MLVTSIFSFSNNVFFPVKDKYYVLNSSLSSCLLILSIWTFLEFCQLVNPFPNKPMFLSVYSISLSKTLWEKKKLLFTTNFSFSSSAFYQFGELSAIFTSLLSASSFSLEESKMLENGLRVKGQWFGSFPP